MKTSTRRIEQFNLIVVAMFLKKQRDFKERISGKFTQLGYLTSVGFFVVCS